MKVKILCRNPDDYLRETKKDIYKVQRNFNPELHPFEASREYVRALNAVKLERLFAKPFLGSLDGHRDGIECLSKHPKHLATIASGCCDGEVKVWDLTARKCKRTIQAHTGFVRGITYSYDGNSFFTVGDDKTVKQWRSDISDEDAPDEPLNVIVAKNMMVAISHHRKEPIFATCGERVDIWNHNRLAPVSSLTWGVASTTRIKFHPIEVNLLGSCASDRSIIIYDMREATPMRKVILKLGSNALSWNPMEAFIFTVANEDYNLYSFDLRHLKRPINVHMDHVSAVMDVDYSPTGKEIVSGSYDKTIRIFPVDKGHSREVYHTKRMQRLKGVLWSLDNKYILSASDEMNIRIWKSSASEKLSLLHSRERVSLSYNKALLEKFAHHPQVKRIARHRHVPKHIYNATKELQAIKNSLKKKEANQRSHRKKGSVPFVKERDRHVLLEEQ